MNGISFNSRDTSVLPGCYDRAGPLNMSPGCKRGDGQKRRRGEATIGGFQKMSGDFYFKKNWGDTPRKTNSSPFAHENRPSQKETSIPTIHFSKIALGK